MDIIWYRYLFRVVDWSKIVACEVISTSSSAMDIIWAFEYLCVISLLPSFWSLCWNYFDDDQKDLVKTVMILSSTNDRAKFSNMWHDQGKWVTLSKNSIPILLPRFLITSICFVLIQTHNNCISGYRVMKNLPMLKTI